MGRVWRQGVCVGQGVVGQIVGHTRSGWCPQVVYPGCVGNLGWCVWPSRVWNITSANTNITEWQE
jgi:hypothetical protein